MLQAQARAARSAEVRRRGTGLSRGWLLVASAAVLVGSDATMSVVAFVLAYRLRFETDLLPIQHLTYWPDYAQMMLLSVATLVITLAMRGQYALRRGVSSIDLAWSIAGSVSIGVLVSIALSTLILKFDYPRAALVAAWGLSIALILAVRLCLRKVLQIVHALGFARSHVLIVGAGQAGRTVLDRTRSMPELGYQAVGLLDDDPALQGAMIAGYPVLGRTSELRDVVRRYRVDEVVLAIPSLPNARLMEIVGQIPGDSVDVKLFPDLFQLTTGGITIDDLAGVPLMTVKRGALRAWDRVVKRAVDVVLGFSALVFLSPVMLIVALLVKLSSRGPVFYFQERVGRNGLRFKALKFRTMRYVAPDEEQPCWTTRGDPRRTRLGIFLRRHSIDEMPQFLNVLAGQMSIVGPRPEQPAYVERFAQIIPRYMDRHQEQCGLTGWAQVNGLRGDTPVAERTRYDLYYVDNWSLLLDFKIMLMTIKRLVADDNAG